MRPSDPGRLSTNLVIFYFLAHIFGVCRYMSWISILYTRVLTDLSFQKPHVFFSRCSFYSLLIQMWILSFVLQRHGHKFVYSWAFVRYMYVCYIIKFDLMRAINQLHVETIVCYNYHQKSQLICRVLKSKHSMKSRLLYLELVQNQDTRPSFTERLKKFLNLYIKFYI